MKAVVKVSLMALGALVVLLFTGGFPLAGAEGVYRSGGMVTAALAVSLLSLWGCVSLSRGKWALFAVGLVSFFLAVSGGVALACFGKAAWRYAEQGGVMWWGFVGMGCLALVGAIFAGLFGWLSLRALSSRLWLAAAHGCLALVAVGAFWDFWGEQVATVRLEVGGAAAEQAVGRDGKIVPLPFSLRVTDFRVSYYDEPSYVIYTFSEGKWSAPESLAIEGEFLRLGEERWPLGGLKRASGMPQPYMLVQGKPLRLIMRQEAPVRDYVARCQVTEEYRPGISGNLREDLRVNEPLSHQGWQVALMSFDNRGEAVDVLVQVRRAPGRLAVIGGIVGLVVSVAFWCWGGEKRNRGEEAAA